jgi:2,4-dienoyl-CoA reductase-like NADH-dependent reductase (Old Yellow Enzyme family)/thioredoxin reductase
MRTEEEAFMQYPRLFQHGKIGRLQIRNRIVMPAMGTNFTGLDGVVSDRNVQYYCERARGGVGLIITEASYIDQTTKNRPHALGSSEDRFVPGLRHLADAIHAEGAACCIQLNHAGKLAPSKVIGCTPLAPSAIPHAATGEVPRAMSREDIRYIVECFAAAAGRASQAGFDAVEVHGAHGYLVHQFLSPLSNCREDEYGGTFENRARFALEVVRAVRERVGHDFPIIFRLSATEYMEGGFTTEEMVRLARWLEAEGVAALDVSAGSTETAYSSAQVVQTMYFEPGSLAKYARMIKDQVSIPVIAVGRINQPQLAEAILARGDADFVAAGRAFTADPHWPRKVLEGRTEEICQCLACNVGCLGRLVQGMDVKCVQNPWVGTDYESGVPAAPTSKRVLVIGGGPAGLEAARVAAARGHRVILLEREAQLGGQVRLACVPPGKAGMQEVVRSRVRDLKKLGVELKCGVEVQPSNISSFTTDVVIEATGALPANLTFPTNFPEKVFSAWSVLAGQELAGERILVIGAGMVGLEIADWLASKAKKVVVIELLDQVGNNITPTVRAMLLARLDAEKVQVITGAMLDHWGPDGAAISKADGSVFRLEAIDNVIAAVGSQPNRVSEMLPDSGIVRKRIGDSEKPRDLLACVSEAVEVAMAL